MLTHAARTLFRMAFTFFVIVSLVFFATRLSGNPIDFVLADGLTREDREILIRYYELDRSLWQQYLAFLRGFWDGQFGLSFIQRRPVSEIVMERLWPSAQLLFAAMLVTIVVAIPMGVVAALYRHHWIGSAVMTVVLIGYAVPNFVLAVLLVLGFGYWLNWLPVVGNATPAHFIMPTVVLSAVLIAALTRFTRNAMLDVLGQDFMRTARAKGMPERTVIVRHGLRNASITVLSVIGLQVAGLAAAGSVVVESIFAWPGIGELLVNSAIRRDYPVLQFGVITVAAAVILINAVIDLAYAWADPRMRQGA